MRMTKRGSLPRYKRTCQVCESVFTYPHTEVYCDSVTCPLCSDIGRHNPQDILDSEEAVVPKPKVTKPRIGWREMVRMPDFWFVILCVAVWFLLFYIFF
jgi:hypothetical protein